MSCTKKPYPSKAIAEIILIGIHSRSNRRQKKERGAMETRAYHCNICGQWHLTSQNIKAKVAL